jgi:hypothetical protein
VDELGQQAARVVSGKEGEVHLLGPVFGNQAHALRRRGDDGTGEVKRSGWFSPAGA